MTGTVADNRPEFSCKDAEEIVREHWGIVGAASDLPSDRDQNFLIRGEAGPVVLKIASAAEDEDLLTVQNNVMEYLGSTPGLTGMARALFSKRGGMLVRVGDDGTTFLARVVTWLPGKTMASVKPHSDGLLRHLGEVLGAMDRRLATFHDATRRELDWDLRSAFGVFERCAEFIADEDRSLFDRFVRRFTNETRLKLVGLREGWIQNDANHHNVLVEERLDGQRVSGIIDFGDMTCSWVIGEVAIASAYAMLDKPKPLNAAQQIVAGYHEAYPLPENEIEVLFDLICMRLCVSVAMSAKQKAAEPNNEYLTVTEAPAWRLLRRLDGVSPDFAAAMFRHACGLQPCPKQEGVVQWLRQQDPHPLTNLDCSPKNLFVHDLSISSSEPGTLCTSGDPAMFEALQIAERTRQAATVGIGRYDEPRLCYMADQFATETSRRTIHIGLDIFEAAGTQLFAPLDGTVHSVANNDKPLDYGPTIILRHETEDGTEFFTLYGHLSVESIEGLQPGDTFARGDKLATFGGNDVNGGWPPHVHFQIMTNMLGKSGDFPGVADADERDVWLSMVPDPNLIARLDVNVRCPSVTSDELLARRRSQLGRSLSLSYSQPLHIVRGSDKYLLDDCGRAYLDTVNNVAHVGHCHPHVVDAGQRQTAVLNTNTRYLHETILNYSQRLAAKLPPPLEVVFLVCSGSEANELAMRMAKTVTGGTDFVVLDSGYHGNTGACVDVSAYKFDGTGGTGAARHVHQVRTPDPYRWGGKNVVDAATSPDRAMKPGTADQAWGLVDAATTGKAMAEDVRAAFSGMSGKPAAFLAETIVSCGGQIVPPDNYLAEAYKHARAAGALCIADEVQTGFGRAGSHFWAFETQGVVPDIVTLGKPIGNGHPMAAVVTTREIADAFANGMEYFNTFGGNAVSCAIGDAVLDVIDNENLQQNAAMVGEFFLSELRSLANRHELIGDVRGRGLFLGIEFVRDRTTKEPADSEASYIVERMKQHRILASTDGPLHNVIKIKPPMVFSTNDARRYCEILDQILTDSVLR